MSSPTPPHASSPASSRDDTGAPPASSAADAPGATAASAAKGRAGAGLPAALSNPALLRTLIRSVPTMASPDPTIPAPDNGRTSPTPRERVSQPHKSTSITTPWNDTLTPMSSQLPAPEPGRPAADIPTDDDLGFQPDSQGLLRTIRQWYYRHPMIADTLIAGGIVLLDLIMMYLSLKGPDADANTTLHLPITLSTLGLCGVLLALRRHYPIRVWAALTIVLEIYYFAQIHVYHLSVQQRASMSAGLVLILILAVPICLGTIASHRGPTVAWTVWAIYFIISAGDDFVLNPSRSFSLPELGQRLLVVGLITAIGVLVGLNARSTRLRFKAMEVRSARMALASEQAALLAAAEERSRIAREMHDVVAHSLAVMITMADGAAATVERNPATAKQAMETLAEAGRSALADTRRLVGVLREDPSVTAGHTSVPDGSVGSASSTGAQDTAPLPDQSDSARRPHWNLKGRTAGASQSPEPPAPSGSPPASARHREVRDLPVPEFAPLGTVTPVEPSAPIASLRQQATDGAGDQSQGDLPLAPSPEQADITELVKRFVAAGVPVSYRWVGAALPEDKALQLTVFRIAQEALTNVLRYAPTTPSVSVDVERYIGTVVLTVDNEAAPGTRPMHGSGKGLIGMRERASVYGGTVQAGPTPTGWRVRAVLRWDEHDEGTFSWQTPL